MARRAVDSVNNIFSHLNRSEPVEIAVGEEAADDATEQRLLGRLGEYAALAVAPLNMRPTGAVLLADEPGRVEVRVSTPGRHIVLVLATRGDLAGELFFLRTMALKNLPAPRLISHDLSQRRLPCTYLLLSHICGAPLSLVSDPALLRVAGRATGRTLRRLHQVEAPGFGRVTPSGRWLAASWHEALLDWLGQRMVLSRAEALLGTELAGALWAATLDHPALAYAQPRVLHGALAPERVLVTAGESVQLEALIRPGDLVAGDPLFDLATGLLPHQPDGFRQGLREGYSASGPLDLGQESRLRRLELLLWVVRELEGDDAALAGLPEAVCARLVALA
ncbi:MAG: hypothetical protein OHK0022_00940 [Roseiflexaceae bacterium]